MDDRLKETVIVASRAERYEAGKGRAWTAPRFRKVPLSQSEVGVAAGPDSEILHS